MDKDTYCLPHLEWSVVDFPITIREIAFETSAFGSCGDWVIVISRDSNYTLSGVVQGTIKDPRKLEQNHFVGKGNIISGEVITGHDSSGNFVRLEGCVLSAFQLNSWAISEQGHFFEAEVILDSACVDFKTEDTQPNSLLPIRIEWFLSGEIDVLFEEITFRNPNLPTPKIRVGFDEQSYHTEHFMGSSSSKDFFQIRTDEISFIVAKVPKEILSGHRGLCFEFRGEMVGRIEQNLVDLRDFFSFLFGTKLCHIGHSILEGKNLRQAFLNSSNSSGRRKPKHPMPPIKYNLHHDWGRISITANKLLPAYLSVQKSLKLNHAIERFWIAKSIPVGANLPVLASAIEILADHYLKMNSQSKLEYLSQDDYNALLGDELKLLETKLTPKEGGIAMMNKIKGAFRRGPNEKITFFFSLIKLEIAEKERQAISLRNKMVHGGRDYDDDNIAHSDIVLTRVYEVLFHRVVLKLLGYDGYYIDYSTQGCPSRFIDNSTGK